MGTIVKRGLKHRAVVRVAGKTLTKSFDKVRDADAWIAATETDIRKAVFTPEGFRNELTLSEVLLKHRDEVLALRPYKVNVQAPTMFAKEYDGVTLNQMTHAWWLKAVASWKVKPVSAQRYVLNIVSALRSGEDLKWGVKVDWASYHEAMRALKRQGMIAEGRARERRDSDEEIAAIKAQITDLILPLADIIDFALVTTMRVGEIARITWADLDQRRKMQTIRDRKDPKRKAGNDHEIPLLADALEIIKRQPKTDARIFPWNAESIGKAFAFMAKLARIKGIHFHDLRHEGITRLFEQGFAIDEVALVSGHTCWETLRKYTHIKADSLHNGPRQRRAA
jgi:integrase